MPCEWHCKWQSYFEISEKCFQKIDKQIKDRKADIFIENSDYVIEIQHSMIMDSEVICRTKDYNLHSKKVIWIIDGNTDDVILDEFSNNSFLVEFKNNWKYKSFVYDYDFVLLDIKGKIFKIPVKLVSNMMIHLKEYKDKDIVINELKFNPNNIWNLWNDNNEIKPNLIIRQQGAGNGKTFGIWKSIALNKDKNIFIITTKQHTARVVIMEELNDQAKRNEFHIIDNMKEIEDNTFGKQFVIKYKHNYSNRNCLVIIGTIDSFVYNLTSKSIGGFNYFEGLLNGIIFYGCDKINSNTGSMKYAGIDIKLNKHTELWIDEAQDLNKKYYKAFVKLMLLTKIDIVIVGDKLQSLEYAENFMTYTEKENNINLIYEEPFNINRRIKVTNMAEKINDIVNFDSYKLPKITVEENLKNVDNPFEIINQQIIYANDTDKNKIDYFVDKLIYNYLDREVLNNNYLPEDFLFIFPIMKNNNLACELETKLNEYWVNKFNDNIYKQYAVLHKHEEGQVIDTTKSINSTRIMSIRSSKGDGRKVIFILNCTEQSLKKLTKNEKNLIYESYLHVALTRSKNKIYFGLTCNNDDIHNRFKSDDLIDYKIEDIKNNFKIDKLTQYINIEKALEIFENKIDNEENEENNFKNNNTIDWEYHCIRYSIYYCYGLFKIFETNEGKNEFKRSQLKTVLDKISKLEIKEYLPKDFYIYLKSKNYNDELDCIPLCIINNKGIYNKYNMILKNIIIKFQKEYKKNNLILGKLDVLESVIIHYLIDLFKNNNNHNITPTNVYNIINCYKNKEEENSLEDFLNTSNNIKNIMNSVLNTIFKNNVDIIWNIEHIILYNGNTDNLKISNKFPIIGYDNKCIHHFVFKTNYNKLNYSEIMIDILFERFIIRNSKGNNREKNNKTRYDNKQIKTYLIIVETNEYKLFDWDWEKEYDNDIKLLLKESLTNYFKQYNKSLFKYCNTLKKDKEKWKEFNSPYNYLYDYIKQKNYVEYVSEFFLNLHRDVMKGKHKEVKKITDDEDLFNYEIDVVINIMVDNYLGLYTNENDNDY